MLSPANTTPQVEQLDNTSPATLRAGTESSVSSSVPASLNDTPLARYLRWREHNPIEEPEVIATVYGRPPKKPESFPAIVKWRGYHMPEYSGSNPWPPRYAPYYGNSVFKTKGSDIWIETTVKDEDAWNKFIFSNWRLVPCGQSKVTGRMEPDKTHQVVGDSIE